MLKIERFAKIEAELKQKGSLDIPSLSQLLGCSEETVRRDLRELEAVGKLNRIRGGAYLSDKYDKTYASPLRRTLYQEEKNQMSLKAMEFIHDRDVIFLDSSTTCLALARQLLGSKLSLTIVTNSMMICSLCTEPNSHINLICLGGSLRTRTLSFVGHGHPQHVLCRLRLYQQPQGHAGGGPFRQLSQRGPCPRGHAQARPAAVPHHGPHEIR